MTEASPARDAVQSVADRIGKEVAEYVERLLRDRVEAAGRQYQLDFDSEVKRV